MPSGRGRVIVVVFALPSGETVLTILSLNVPSRPWSELGV
jgi:hypothetical protein